MWCGMVWEECLDRCRHLVEVCGEDVTKGDSENITVLHWAAINNRIAVASYLIQVSAILASSVHELLPPSDLKKGANPNVTGGELASTPIHWATRQGHLPMVILLLRYGANPETLDAEGQPSLSLSGWLNSNLTHTGLNCLHIAAQFGFTNIVAYYITCHIPMVTSAVSLAFLNCSGYALCRILTVEIVVEELLSCLLLIELLPGVLEDTASSVPILWEEFLCKSPLPSTHSMCFHLCFQS